MVNYYNRKKEKKAQPNIRLPSVKPSPTNCAPMSTNNVLASPITPVAVPITPNKVVEPIRANGTLSFVPFVAIVSVCNRKGNLKLSYHWSM